MVCAWYNMDMDMDMQMDMDMATEMEMTRTGLTTMSEMPVIPCRRISSANEKASWSGTPSGTISRSCPPSAGV